MPKVRATCQQFSSRILKMLISMYPSACILIIPPFIYFEWHFKMAKIQFG